MVHDHASWLIKTRRAGLAVAVAALPFACLDSPAVHAQSITRTPNLNIQSPIPTNNPTVVPRIDPNIAGRTAPNLRTRPACSDAYRNGDGECQDQPVASADGGGGAGGASGKTQRNRRHAQW